MSKFVHLRCHSDFSITAGLPKVGELAEAAFNMSSPALGVTDLNNLFGQVRFFRACLEKGVKPITAADVLVIEPDGISKVTLFVQNEKGYRSILTLLSLIYTEDQQTADYVPALESKLLREHSDGLMLMFTARESLVGQMLRKQAAEDAWQHIERWRSCFSSVYLEVCRTGREGDEEHVQAAYQLSLQRGIPLVATNDVYFLTRSDFEAHEARSCIASGHIMEDPKRPKDFSEEQYFKSHDEMQALFKDLPEAIENTWRLAECCNNPLQLGVPYLPRFPVPEGMTEASFLQQCSEEGLRKRFQQLHNSVGLAEDEQVYWDRLKMELEVINSMGFPGYFLIVMDFIRWSKDHGIPVGPGRGSGAGSLVAYAIDITDLDPIRYDLLFERFLNPERVSLPDFDIDFCMDRRDEVIRYVADTYGHDAVSQIVTFGTMAAKAVVRDAARVLGRPYGAGDRISRMIPTVPGMNLKKALDSEKNELAQDLKRLIDTDDEVREIWGLGEQLEGRTRNLGKHAGGVVIAPSKLTDFVPLYKVPEEQGLITQFDKDDVESAGLVKFDFLGLRTLTIIDWALKNIQSGHRASEPNFSPIDINAISLDVPDVYSLMQQGYTTAVFQLESRGMKELMKRLKPSCFDDIVALVALFRPGPLDAGMDEDYINRKHGRMKVEYPHPDLEPVLQNTYGTILYQEQVMQIAQVLAGYSLGQADMLRRAMGKKKPEVMAEQRVIFCEGAEANNIDAQLASDIFDLMEKFAGYGFNKSHSAAYALLSYQTAWLKCFYPAEFLAAVLTADMDNTDKLVLIIQECQRMKLKILPPDINASQRVFSVPENRVIRYGLGAIKGLGDGPIQAILEAREESKFTNFFDTVEQLYLTGRFNKRTFEALIRSGAMDALGPDLQDLALSRHVMMSTLAEAISTAEQSKQNASLMMTDLFEAEACEQEESPWKNRHLPPSPQSKFHLKDEKAVLGFYLSGHPINQYKEELAGYGIQSLKDIGENADGQIIAGFIADKRIRTTRSGDRMAVVLLQDDAAEMEITLFSDVWEVHRDDLVDDAVVLFEGKARKDRFRNAIAFRADRVFRLENLRSQKLSTLKSKTLDLDNVDIAKALETIKGLSASEAGPCSVQLSILVDGLSAELMLGEQISLMPTDEVLHALETLS